MAFPLLLDLTGQTVLLLGEGPTATRRAASLAAAGALLRRAGSFAPALLDDCRLAFGVDAPEAELIALAAAARRRGIPVNITDRPELCSFTMPAIVQRGAITIAIATGGTSPILARMLRSRIEALLHPNLAALAEFAAQLRQRVQAEIAEPQARRRAIEKFLTGPLGEIALAQGAAAACAALPARLAQPAAGMAVLLSHISDDPDALTLRAVRYMQQADLLVHDNHALPVLALARLDAPTGDAGTDIQRHVADGMVVVRLYRPGDCERAAVDLAKLESGGFVALRF